MPEKNEKQPESVERIGEDLWPLVTFVKTVLLHGACETLHDSHIGYENCRCVNTIYIGPLDKKDNAGVNTVLNTGLNTGVNTRVNTRDNT